ncbi:glycosyltransferase family 39 protein [Streptomyces sp. CAU 1734]|uniref:glycosyltransferase family 39 protein n=1 Tax=Streptomyces sp. CAU 1734 TaxID=3140360 RepID=UPI003260E87B
MLTTESCPDLPPARRTRSRPEAPGSGALLLSVPLLWSCALGAWGLSRGGSLWQDEAISHDMARRDLGEIWATVQDVDAVHGLYYALLHVVFEVFGPGLGALRWPSVIAMGAAAGAVALLGRELAGARAGWAAGLVFPLLPAVQQYAQEGRSYALVTCLVTWSTWALVRAARKPPGRAWIPYAALLAAACWMHEFALLVLPAHALALAALRADRRVLRSWALAAACAVAAGLPVIVVSMRQAAQVSWIAGTSWGDVTPWALAAAIGALGRLVLRRTEAAGAWEAALALFLGPAVTLLVLSLFRDLYVDRYVLYAQAGLALLVGVAVERCAGAGLWRWVAGAGAAAFTAYALAVAAPALRSPDSRSDDVRAMVSAIGEMDRSADGFVFLPSNRRAWVLHDNPEVPPHFTDLLLRQSPRASDTLYGTDVTSSAVADRMTSVCRILAVRDPGLEKIETSPQDDEKRRVLDQEFTARESFRVSKAQITLFVRNACAE